MGDVPDQATTEDLVYDGYSGDRLLPFAHWGSTLIHVLRGQCDAEVENDDGEETHRCRYRAALRHVTEDEMEQFCFIHAPDEWEEKLDGENQYDDTIVSLVAPCDAHVSKTRHGEPTPEGGESPAAFRCGDRGLLTISTGVRDSRTFCRRHARDTWIASAEVETGYPENPNGIEEGWEDDKLFIDIPSGEVYEDSMAWMDGVSGQYSDVITAEEYLVVEKEGERRVYSPTENSRF